MGGSSSVGSSLADSFATPSDGLWKKLVPIWSDVDQLIATCFRFPMDSTNELDDWISNLVKYDWETHFLPRFKDGTNLDDQKSNFEKYCTNQIRLYQYHIRKGGSIPIKWILFNVKDAVPALLDNFRSVLRAIDQYAWLRPAYVHRPQGHDLLLHEQLIPLTQYIQTKQSGYRIAASFYILDDATRQKHCEKLDDSPTTDLEYYFTGYCPILGAVKVDKHYQ